MSISTLLDEFAKVKRNNGDALPLVVKPPQPFPKGIPTLEKGKYRTASPMLRERFEHAGRMDGAWLRNSWLSVPDMEAAWEAPSIQKQLEVRRVHWDGGLTQSHAAGEISLFGIDTVEQQETYLLWASGEPEVWVYAGQSEHRYANLQEFLQEVVEASRAPSPKRFEVTRASDRKYFARLVVEQNEARRAAKKAAKEAEKAAKAAARVARAGGKAEAKAPAKKTATGMAEPKKAGPKETAARKAGPKKTAGKKAAGKKTAAKRRARR